MALNTRDKWTAYKSTPNVYEIWMPTHLKRICSVTDQLPAALNFEASQESELPFTEDCKDFGSLLANQFDVEPASRTSHGDSELAPVVSQTLTSVSQAKEQATPKRPKRKHIANHGVLQSFG